MSDTENFESVIERVNAEIAEIEVEDRPFPYRLSANVLRNLRDRLQSAHEREIAEALCDACDQCDRIDKKAYEHEIEHLRKAEYSRGYHDGQHSMDAEHRAVAMRLRALHFADGGCHGRLSEIAHAVYPEYRYAWTQGACAELRDELVRLMGGVSDENVHVGGLRCVDGCGGDVSSGEDTGRTHDSYSSRDRNHMAVREGVDTVIGDSDDTCDSQCRGACAAGDGRDSVEQAEVSDDCVDCDILGPDARGHAVGRDFHEMGVTDGRVADDSGADTGCGNRGGDLHMAGMMYDVLGNERQKAVCELRKMTIDSDYHSNYQRIALAIGTVYDGRSFASECVRDRLIHLLGGDQPSGIDVLNGTDLSKKSVDAMSKRAMEEREVEGRITDELREFVGTFSKRLSINVAEVNAIADRIDAQFDRICAQHEAVLQSTIDEVVEERDHLKHVAETNSNTLLRISGENASLKADCEKLEKLRDRWCQQATDLMNRADDMERQCDNLLDLLRDARDEYKTLVQASAEASAHFHVMRGKVWSLEVERDELQEKMDEYDSTYVELPRDANGEVFRVGCTVKMVERHPEVLLTVHSMTLRDDGEWLLFAWDDKDEYSCNLSTLEFEVCEPKPDTAESIVRDLSMGAVTESEAVSRIEALNG